MERMGRSSGWRGGSFFSITDGLVPGHLTSAEPTYPDFNWREATMTKGYIPIIIARSKCACTLPRKMYLRRAILSGSALAA